MLYELKLDGYLAEPVRYALPLDAALPVLVQSLKTQGLEGLVAKRRNSLYEPTPWSDAGMKMRVDGPTGPVDSDDGQWQICPSCECRATQARALPKPDSHF